jgi:hypothetical protein
MTTNDKQPNRVAWKGHHSLLVRENYFIFPYVAIILADDAEVVQTLAAFGCSSVEAGKDLVTVVLANYVKVGELPRTAYSAGILATTEPNGECHEFFLIASLGRCEVVKRYLSELCHGGWRGPKD